MKVETGNECERIRSGGSQTRSGFRKASDIHRRLVRKRRRDSQT